MTRSISAVLIVRDEEAVLARALDSVRDHVDEIVVADTGSTDRTVEVAEAHGATVVHVPWTDDFAAARNAALDRATGDWRLVLDADEWLESGAETLRGLRVEDPAFVGMVLREDAFGTDVAGSGGERRAPTLVERLLPRGVAYAGRIHEQVVSPLPRRRLAMTLGHDGYRPARLRAKGMRNERLLRQALRESPRDVYLHYQLGKELDIAGRSREAAEHFARADQLGSGDEHYRHDLVVRWLHSLGESGQFDRGEALIAAEAEAWPTADFHFTAGDFLLREAENRPERFAELIAGVEREFLAAFAAGDSPDDLPGHVRGRGSFLAAHNLAALYAALGDSGQAVEWGARAQPLQQ